jgi:hypothetical protein
MAKISAAQQTKNYPIKNVWALKKISSDLAKSAKSKRRGMGVSLLLYVF